MANGAQFEQQDDELDFRPAAQARPAATSDGIDFQPAGKPTSTLRTPTLEELQSGALPPLSSEEPATPFPSHPFSPLPAKPSARVLDVAGAAPRSAIGGELNAPPVLTEEEIRRAGTIGPRPVGVMERAGRALLPGLNPNATLQGNEPIIDPNRGLVAPQNIMTESEQSRHPILTGLGQLGEGLTTPENLAILAGSYGIGELPAAARSALSAFFATQMAKGATDYGVQGWKAYQRGDNAEAQRLWTLAAGSAALGGLTGAHAIRESGVLPEIREPVVPYGTVSAPLLKDAAVARAQRVMPEVEANAAARRGLSGVDRAVEAARQATLNAPVNLPRLPETTERTPILPGPAQGPERNPLEVEAQRVREERALRGQPGFRVTDLRRVVPENPEEPPYYTLPEFPPQPSKRLVEPAPAGETIGARGRSERLGELGERLVGQQDESLLRRFGPEVLTEAREEIRNAADLAGAFDRPGRYYSENEGGLKDKGVLGTGFGTWYGVSSSRGAVAERFPWYGEITEGADKLAELAQKGTGAQYDRILERVADGIAKERESARPVIEEYLPQLRQLSEQIRDVDPDLSQTLLDVAGGKAVGYRNLREYIEGKLHDAHAAALFSKAVDEAASEAGEPAGAAEPPRLGGAAREAEGRGEETARESVGAVAPGGIDFQPLPEPQPINPREVEDMSRLLGRSVTAEELPGIRRRLDAERNISEGLKGNLRDEAGEIREAYRDKLERGEILPERATAPDYESAAKKLGVEFRGVIGADAGLGDKAVITFQDPVSRGSIGVRVGEWSPDVLERKLSEKREELRGTATGPQKEIFNQSALEAAKDATAQKPKVSGTTLYSNAFLDPAAWREAFPSATKALVRFGDTTLSAGDIMRGILREQTGELVRRKEQLYNALEAKANEWDARPAKEQLDFILREQRGQKQVNAADQMIADKLRQMFAERREQIENLGHGAFQRWRENYFPQMWERPNQVRDWITQVLAGKRRMEGPASFKKQRVFEDIQEGIDAGFKPLTTNPITLALAKLHEMDRYTMAHTTLDSMKKAGLAKAVMVGQQAPAGWQRLSEGIGTIYGGGDIRVKEAYDKAVWDRLSEVAKNLGIEHKRAVGIGGTRLGYATPGKITTRFATPESVIAHEIGHNLDWKYGLKDQLVKNPLYAKELRALADLHIEGMSPADVPQSFQRYIRKGEEKMATMVEALIHAPDKFQEVAPHTWDFLHKFIADKPELKPLLEAKPSLRYDTRTSPVSAGGIVIHGYYFAPEEAARVFNNYLSPGLQRFKTYNAVRMLGNTLNQAQLGLSAFHLGFTSLDASVSDMALALERLSRGEVARSMAPAMRSVSVLGSPINTLLKGNKLLREYMEPGKFAEMAKLADAVAQAGGRVHMDPYYKNQAIESFWKAWKEGNYGKAGLRAFPAAMEYAAKPVMEYAVPRMKLGVFANLAEDVLARSDRESWKPEKTRYELNRAWDSVDNRMGQIVYDNLFWNRAVKDLGLVSVRSLGWNLGTAREIGGGAVDTARQLARLGAGEKAELTHRMAYVMALPIVVGFTGALVHYLSTGKKPETLTDYYFPQTGKIGPNGRPERLSLPSYVKDIVELNQHPARTILNKVHPAITATAQFLRNEDYYGTEIRHPDDPFLRQRLDDAEFVAKQFLPFSIRNAYQRAESAGGTGIAGPVEKRSLPGTLESMIGLVPAPRSLMETHAERMAHEAAVRNMPQGPRTREQFEHSVLLRSYQNRIRSGEMKPGGLRDEIAAGRITVHDAEKIARGARSNPLEQDFARLSLADALDVWNVATPEEREQLRPELFRKGAQLKNMPADERQVFEKRLREALRGQAQATSSANFWGGALRGAATANPGGKAVVGIIPRSVSEGALRVLHGQRQ